MLSRWCAYSLVKRRVTDRVQLLVAALNYSRFEEISEDKPSKKDAKKSITAASAAPISTPESKKRKAEEPASTEKPAAKKTDKKQKVETVSPAATAAAPEKKKKEAASTKPESQGSKKRTLANGLVIEDVKVGDGAVAKSGKRCGMR